MTTAEAPWEIANDGIRTESFESGTWSVYLAFDADFQVLYVGQTRSPERRVQAHKSSSPWSSQVASYLFERDLPSEQAALTREAELIKIHQPLYNRTHTCHRLAEYLPADPPMEVGEAQAAVAAAWAVLRRSQLDLRRAIDSAGVTAYRTSP